MRALFKKAPVTKERLDINEVVEEVLILTQIELQRNRVSPHLELANDLPLILGDRIELQQVMLNLLINAIEAMSGVGEGPRELWVSSQKVTEIPGQSEEHTLEHEGLVETKWTRVLIAVRDTGPGLDPKALDRLFDAFYTTKPRGLGVRAGDQPFDCRSSRRTALGDGKCAPRGRVSIRVADSRRWRRSVGIAYAQQRSL